jgi:hypothetical protein
MNFFWSNFNAHEGCAALATANYVVSKYKYYLNRHAIKILKCKAVFHNKIGCTIQTYSTAIYTHTACVKASLNTAISPT